MACLATNITPKPARRAGHPAQPAKLAPWDFESADLVRRSDQRYHFLSCCRVQVLFKDAEAKKDDYNLVHYNLACLYSVTNRLDSAMDALRSTVELGFTNLASIEEVWVPAPHMVRGVHLCFGTPRSLLPRRAVAVQCVSHASLCMCPWTFVQCHPSSA